MFPIEVELHYGVIAAFTFAQENNLLHSLHPCSVDLIMQTFKHVDISRSLPVPITLCKATEMYKAIYAYRF